MRLNLILSLFFVFATATGWADTYSIDKDHSTAGFTVRHIMSKVTGSFDDVSGTINFDEKNVSKSSVEVVIKTTSINTRVAKRDDHLRSAEFFDAAKFPEMTFKSKKVTGSGKKFKIEGLLTMHGVEKPVVLATEYLGSGKDPWGNYRASFSATTKVNRKDFGLTWNKTLETGGVLIGDEVDINLDIEAIKKAEDKPAVK